MGICVRLLVLPFFCCLLGGNPKPAAALIMKIAYHLHDSDCSPNEQNERKRFTRSQCRPLYRTGECFICTVGASASCFCVHCESQKCMSVSSDRTVPTGTPPPNVTSLDRFEVSERLCADTRHWKHTDTCIPRKNAEAAAYRFSTADRAQ